MTNYLTQHKHLFTINGNHDNKYTVITGSTDKGIALSQLIEALKCKDIKISIYNYSYLGSDGFNHLFSK